MYLLYAPLGVAGTFTIHFGSLLLAIGLLRLCDGILELERVIEDIGEGFTHRVFLEKVPVVMVALLLTPHA